MKLKRSNYRNEIEEKKGWKRWNNFSKTTLENIFRDEKFSVNQNVTGTILGIVEI
ncbi:4292_t:CDS:2 [Funneliformis mosseae]|uniref:4292_t:CDS:1 n=1 Tax=Funneliformis mosseae TaxID=27381 RepID=A0A9N9A5Y6_FUNMO|nr:4292_t:CDS:2 [Funneliformis mosseae]